MRVEVNAVWLQRNFMRAAAVESTDNFTCKLLSLFNGADRLSASLCIPDGELRDS